MPFITVLNGHNESKDTASSRGCSPDNANSDFLLSNSFSNVSYQRYGLNIEEGQSGKYQPLPEAQSQLLPPDKFMQLQQDFPLRSYTSHAEKKALIASRRRSRSMETFSKLHHPEKKELSRTRQSTRSHTDVMVHNRQR